MITILGIDNKIKVGGKNEFLFSFMFDKIAEVVDLPTVSYDKVGNVAVHSMALCGESGKVYQLDGDRNWVLVGGQ